MLDSLYENIGGKIKSYAKWVFIIEAICAVITGIAMIATNDDMILYGILTLVLGPVIAWVGSWILYAFGQLVEDVHAMRNEEGTEAEVKAKRESEEKAKCDKTGTKLPESSCDCCGNSNVSLKTYTSQSTLGLGEAEFRLCEKCAENYFR